jgi:prepilin-type N-terminal cleavage/methylation domain-containing protein/prepilin-type processing-associated H-X9-DG protein
MRRRHGFTLIELLVVIAIIAILAAILFPVFAQAREKARASACLSNAKQIATALYMYVQDFDETYPCKWIYRFSGGQTPPSIRWNQALVPYLKNDLIYKCPSHQNRYGDVNRVGLANYLDWGVSYGINENGFGYSPGGVFPLSMAAVQYPAEVLFCAETQDQDTPTNPGTDVGRNAIHCPFGAMKTGPIPARHMQGFHVVYADGHAKWMRQSTALAECAKLPKGWESSRLWNPVLP